MTGTLNVTSSLWETCLPDLQSLKRVGGKSRRKYYDKSIFFPLSSHPGMDGECNNTSMQGAELCKLLWFRSEGHWGEIVDHEWFLCVSTSSYTAELHALSHTHGHARHSPLAQSFHCLGVTMETPSSSPPNTHHRHITPTTGLRSVILWAAGKRNRSMTERNGLSGSPAEKRNHREERVQRVVPAVIPPSAWARGARRVWARTSGPQRQLVFVSVPAHTFSQIAAISDGWKCKYARIVLPRLPPRWDKRIILSALWSHRWAISGSLYGLGSISSSKNRK